MWVATYRGNGESGGFLSMWNPNGSNIRFLAKAKGTWSLGWCSSWCFYSNGNALCHHWLHQLGETGPVLYLFKFLPL